MPLRFISGLLGVIMVVVVLWDVFETIILPRRVARRIRLTRLFYQASWKPWSAIARTIHSKKRREAWLGFFGPLSLVALLVCWAVGLVFGFAMLHWAIGSHLSSLQGASRFAVDLYMSGTTFFTLGLGDVAPLGTGARAITVIEACTGFGLLALVIGYFPVLYQSFSRREVHIAMLDARAGTPPTAAELLRRHREGESMHALDLLLRDWEHWAADLLESHLSYPVLCFFRSQHDNQSWLAALTTVLDTCSLAMVGIEGAPKWQAQLTFKMARHTVVDLAQIFNTSPLRDGAERLAEPEFARLRIILDRAGIPLGADDSGEEVLRDLRAMYEPYVKVLADYLLMTLPPWLPKPRAVDNWQTSAWETNPDRADQPIRRCMERTPCADAVFVAKAPE